MDQPGSQTAKPASKPLNNGCAGDVKPRLTKEQHDVLEAHFQQQRKPSTLTKRNFADNLGVPIDKINNWFQNRRAKVKQDYKKAMNNYAMGIGVYPQPIGCAPYPTHIEHPQPPPPMVPDFYSSNADISPTSLPIQSVEGPSALDLESHYAMHAYGLGPIPEVHPDATYGPQAVMQSFLAATTGHSYMQAVPLTSPNPDYSYEVNGLPASYPCDIALTVPNTLPNESAPADLTFNDFTDFAAQDSNSANAQISPDSISPEQSPASGARSSSAAQSGGPNIAKVQSITSMYSGYTEEPTDIRIEEPSDQSYSDNASSMWITNGQGPTGHADTYQHPNASAQNLMPSPQHTAQRKLSTGPGEFETLPLYADEALSRRNSSTTNLANNIGAINIQNRQSPDDFKLPVQPSSIAARRHKRPTALNPTTLRSASYTSGMSSPGSNDQTLRRIRSSGIPGAAGRVQKPNPGSAPRSPRVPSAPRSPLMPSAARSSFKASLEEVDDIPKFIEAISNSHGCTVGQGGSLGPPTPSTPGDARFPYWQSNTVMGRHAPMPEHSSPESLNANWSVEPQSAGLYSSADSPSSDPFAHFSNDNPYHDTPPQSAPATQQSFPYMGYMQRSQMGTSYHSTSDLTIVQSKSSHMRRPSLPESSIELDQKQMQYPVQFSEVHYDNRFGAINLDGISRHNVPFAPQAHDLPDFPVHEYGAPPGMSQSAFYRRSTEPQPKSYVFANSGLHSFR